MSHWIYATDGSFDELTFDEARKLKAAGVQCYAQCLWTGREQPPSRIVSLRNAQQAGIPKLVGYISVAPGHRGDWHMDQGRAGVPLDIWNALIKTPVDVELTGMTFAEQVAPALDRIAALGKPKDIYTSYNAWVNYLGNPTRPDGVGLWNALWDLHPDFDFPTLRYGGWQDVEVWGEQWSGGTNVEGQFVDRNQFRAEALGLHLPEPSVPSTPVPVPPPSDAAWLSATGVAATLAVLFSARQRPNDQLRETIKFLIQA